MAQLSLVLDALKECGITDVVGLPDNASAALFLDPTAGAGIRRIAVTREGEAFALASGLWLGGRTPAVVIQNTGLLESGDAYRGTALRMRVPLLCLVTFRGYARLGGIPEETARRPGADDLSRPDIDSVALMTEPTLKAWGLPCTFLHDDEDVPVIGSAYRKATSESRPVAVLVTRNMT
jgi:sulfopyruvate decarboxylase subunit alpha